MTSPSQLRWLGLFYVRPQCVCTEQDDGCPDECETDHVRDAQLLAVVEPHTKLQSRRQELHEANRVVDNVITQITQNLGIVKDLSEQTNVFALNTAIEAANAGDLLARQMSAGDFNNLPRVGVQLPCVTSLKVRADIFAGH